MMHGQRNIKLGGRLLWTQ